MTLSCITEVQSTIPSHQSVVRNSFEHEGFCEKRKLTRVETPWRTSLHPTDRIWSQCSFPGSQVASWWSAHGNGTHTECTFLRRCFHLRPWSQWDGKELTVYIRDSRRPRMQIVYPSCTFVSVKYINFVFVYECRYACAKVHVWKLRTTLGVASHRQCWLKQGLLFTALLK